MVRERRKRLGEPRCANAERSPDDVLLQRQREEILRLQGNVEDEIIDILQAIGHQEATIRRS